MTKHSYFLTLVLLISSTTQVTAKPLRIVASIKPVHSLVAGITQGVIEPELLMGSQQSPHHYSLRPSERRMLAKADLIFWIGPSLESFLPRILGSLKNKKKSVSLMQTQGLHLLPLRQIDNDHREQGHDEHDHSAGEQASSKMDAHFWLNTYNADILVDVISQKIINLDPEHQQQYQANSQRLHDQIAQLRKTLQTSLSSVKNAFLTYHDGYQYFEAEFNLNNAGFITASELQPGARRISELKKLIEEKNIECIFYDAPTEPPILKSLVANNKTNTFMLDPVGVFIPPGKNAWFETIHALTQQFINCRQSI
ncbi:MAG: zinc ABC transporter substrate-binding protein [Gammaproteobacteria bacterium]|nr:zinc ABC transporter substrate-binding protein [Gammaproteobacteria bacterium]